MSHPEVLAEPGRRVLTLGNVAIARACLESGVGFAAAYPGTPSSEILEALSFASGRLGFPYVEWSVNEKVAFEASYGAAIAGVPSVVTMKHVGLNVAADPLFSSAYTGVKAPFLIVSADDPGMWSSQNEQDNRWYGLHAYVPVIEPLGAQGAREAALEAIRISGEVEHPVILRVTTRISHTRSVYVFDEIRRPPMGKFERDPARWTLIPAHARRRKEELLKKWERLSELFSSSKVNVIEGSADAKTAVIGVGIGYRYAKEALATLGLTDKVSLVGISTVVPLPLALLRKALASKERAIVIEEGDPIFEDMLRSAVREERIEIFGKRSGHLPLAGELRVEAVTVAIARAIGLEPPAYRAVIISEKLPPRPPVLCPGCPYRGVFYELKRVAAKMKKRLLFAGDIGCYSLAINPPLSAQDTIVEMGGSIGLGHAFSKVVSDSLVVATIGDSTFYHAGLPALVNAAYNRSSMLVLVLDNGTTAMTGHQPNPSSGRRASGEEGRRIPIEAIASAMGASVRVARSFSLKEVGEEAKRALETAAGGELSVLIARGPCILEAVATARREKIKRPTYKVMADKCRSCTICYNHFACPAIFSAEGGKAVIEPRLCTGCGVCAEVCPFGAIVPEGEESAEWRALLRGGP